ncbi:MAG: hypothetical protein H6672_17240 [Anaerolineaceae bacterium]|nr:hypothetical protein [Anaerolineaceae bacterium]
MDKNMIRYGLLLAALVALLAIPMIAALAQDSTEVPVATEEAAAVTETAPAPAQVDTGLVSVIRYLHSIVRWVVVAVTLVTLVKLVMGVVQGGAFDALAQRLMLIFSMTLSLQWAIGIVLLIAVGSVIGFGNAYLWEHAGTMTVALALAHMHNRWKKSPDSTRYRASLAIVVVVLVLVFVGVATLPQGWRVLPS